MHTREYKPDPSFRASIDMMDEIEDCKTYVAEYFSWNVPRHGEAVFTELDDAERFLFRVYVASYTLNKNLSASSNSVKTASPCRGTFHEKYSATYVLQSSISSIMSMEARKDGSGLYSR